MTFSGVLPKGSDLEGSAQPADTKAGRSDPQGIQKSILATLAYSAHFSFPLTLEEIHIRLIGASLPAQAGSSRQSLNYQITQMLKTKSIFQSGKYYFLPGHSHLVTQRNQNRQYSVPALAKAKSLATKLSHVPGVLAIYLTGSLAMSNSNSGSDIDFMIITQPNLLWTTRFILTIYTSLFGLRRTPSSTSFSSKLCLNLYLSPNSYLLPPDRRSLYTAYELIQAVPLYDPTNTHSKLLSANAWIHNYLPNAHKGSGLLPRTFLKRNSRLQVEKGPAGTSSATALEKWLQKRSILGAQQERTVLNGILGILESTLYHLQLLYMKNKITREYITPDCAFFHPHDPSPKVRPAK